MTTISVRPYQRDVDFDRVGEFLVRHYQPENRDGNWLQPAWEYMHFHPALNEAELNRIGIWEDDGRIVAVCHYEWRLGEAFFQLHPEYGHLKPEMVDYATAHLGGVDDEGKPQLALFINDNDPAFEAITLERGYKPTPDNYTRPMTRFTIPDPFPPIALPAGFRLLSLADENDLGKINRVLWRGFNHPGEPPAKELPGRVIMQSGPHFRHDLTIVVAEPGGQFVSFCGMWYEPTNRYAYVEPVATDPDYRRLGLGKAAVMEGIRRCAALGATVAYVGSDQEFYLALGFEPLFAQVAWRREENR